MSVLPIKDKKEPFCQCLHEIESNLPRTQHCFMACSDQFEIIAERQKLLKDVDVLVKNLENAVRNDAENAEIVIDRKPKDLSLKDLLGHIKGMTAFGRSFAKEWLLSQK